MSSISAGTTSGTALVSTGDTTGTLDLKTGASATTALSIDASQNVGIGTSSPGTKLEVYGSGQVLSTVNSTNANGGLYSVQSSGVTAGYIGSGKAALGASYNALDMAISTAGAYSVILGTNNTGRLIIDTSGNVGIGVSSPSYKLHVANYMALGTQASTGAGAGINMIPSSTLTNWFVGSNYVNSGAFEIIPSTSGGGSTFTTPALTLSSAGNLGLGVTPGTIRLEVSGSSVGSIFNAIRIDNQDTTANAYVQMIFLSGDDGTARNRAAVFAGSDASNSGFLGFSTRNSGTLAERARITSDGYLRMASGTGGIQFNGDTAAANALDDYEEGTWTPTLGGTTTDPTSVNYGLQEGVYRKIGGLVVITGRLAFSTYTGGSGSLLIRGLPFTVSGGPTNWGTAMTEYIDFPAGKTFVAHTADSTTTRLILIFGGDNVTYDSGPLTTVAPSSGTFKYVTFGVAYVAA